MRAQEAAHESLASVLALKIGKRGLVRAGQLEVEVEVYDAKMVYGRVLLLVRPVAGHGETWVDAQRVRLDGAI